MHEDSFCMGHISLHGQIFYRICFYVFVSPCLFAAFLALESRE